MAVRRLNYTGRKRIRQADTRITIYQAGDRHSAFDAELSLGRYGLPPSASVFVEAYRQTFWMRFPFGTVSSLQPPEDRRLTDFDSAEAVLFRVKVASADDRHGVLLAEADRIQPRRPEEAEENRIPLMPVKPDDDLGEQVCCLDFSDRPILLINSRAGDWRALAREPAFASLVYPAAFREVLTRILYAERHYDASDRDDWRSLWLRFAEALPGVSESPAEGDEDEFDDWINEAVASFCRKNGMMRRFGQYWTGEAQT